ncbi:MAG: hypothetical protein AAFY70_06415 [Bacteroidota bacterium]
MKIQLTTSTQIKLAPELAQHAQIKLNQDTTSLDLSQAFESDQKSRTFIIIYVDDDFLRPGTAQKGEKVLPNPSSALHLKLE